MFNRWFVNWEPKFDNQPPIIKSQWEKLDDPQYKKELWMRAKEQIYLWEIRLEKEKEEKQMIEERERKKRQEKEEKEWKRAEEIKQEVLRKKNEMLSQKERKF